MTLNCSYTALCVYNTSVVCSPYLLHVMPSVYTVVSGHVDKNLNRWSNEVHTYSRLINLHRGPALCALERAAEAHRAFSTADKILNDLLKEGLV